MAKGSAAGEIIKMLTARDQRKTIASKTRKEIKGSNFVTSPVIATYQEDSTAETIDDLKSDFNALLAKLITAGIMSSE